MSSYSGLSGECVMIKGDKGDMIEAYYAKPAGKGPFPGVVLIHHAPGWDEWITGGDAQAARSMATRPSRRISIIAKAPAIPTTSRPKRAPKAAWPTRRSWAMSRAAMAFLRAQPEANGKVGLIGFCSGGRHVYLCRRVACRMSTPSSTAGAATSSPTTRTIRRSGRSPPIE